MKKYFTQLIIGAFFFIPFTLLSQTPTIGLIQHTSGSLDDGYVLFAPMGSKTTYLIDKCGKEVHSWLSIYKPGLAVYLLENGNLLRTGFKNDTLFTFAGGSGGIIENIDWNSNVLWSYAIADTLQCQHHDIKELPNGNVLVLVWELKTRAEAIAVGRDSSLIGQNLLSEKIVELQPVGIDSAVVVWEWHVWDHLVQDFDNTKPNFSTVSSNPQLFNINFSADSANSDWLHFNSIDYNPTFDQILVSNHNFGEIFIIDHSTTIAQAAGHSGGNYSKGGDLLYRWGNPAAYNNGTIVDQKLSSQHNAQWIRSGLPNVGKIMIFNNRHPSANPQYSSIEIIDPPVDSLGVYTSTLPYLPNSSFWTYSDSANFYAPNVSGAQQLSNGNVLICKGPKGDFFEIDNSKNKVWEYINPVIPQGPLSQGTIPFGNQVFRCTFYPNNYSGFNNQVLTSGQPIEWYPYPYTCNFNPTIVVTNENTIENIISIYPNPSADQLNVVLMNNETTKIKSIEIINSLGQTMIITNNTIIDISAITNGLYLIKVVTSKGEKIIKRMVKNK